MRLVRRTHLFAGLFMLPWVVLYGVTAFLFNHPDAFPDHPPRTFGAAEFSGTAVEGLPSPAEAAAQVVAALRAEAAGRSDPLAGCELAHPEQASYSRDDLFALARGGGQEHVIQFDLTTNTGVIRSRPVGPIAEAVPFAPTRGVRIDRPLPERFEASLPIILNRLGLAHEEVTLDVVPDLVFLLEADGRLWRVTYDMQRGRAVIVPLGSPGEPLSTRQFLTRLHLAHGYTSNASSRWFWAVVVDAMCVVMLFWAVSGVLMWWQIKAVRGWGLAVLALSGLTATLLAVGMYRALAP
jgi:hypothetical protein